MGWFSWITTTGQCECDATWVETEPSSALRVAPTPRAPTTTVWATLEASTRADAAPYVDTSQVTVRSGWVVFTWATAFWQSSSAISRTPSMTKPIPALVIGYW